MSQRPHTTHRLAILAGAVAVLVAVALLVDVHVALGLGPAVALLASVAVGWLPGEARLARVVARRAARQRVAVGAAPRIRRWVSRRIGDRGRILAGGRSSRGPPLLHGA